jgi:hypothetical protein
VRLVLSVEYVLGDQFSISHRSRDMTIPKNLRPDRRDTVRIVAERTGWKPCLTASSDCVVERRAATSSQKVAAVCWKKRDGTPALALSNGRAGVRTRRPLSGLIGRRTGDMQRARHNVPGLSLSWPGYRALRRFKANAWYSTGRCPTQMATFPLLEKHIGHCAALISDGCVGCIYCDSNRGS